MPSDDCSDSNEVSKPTEPKRKEIITTEDELKCYALVKDILKNHDVSLDDINYKDTTNYFSIYTRNPSRWIMRLQLDISKKNVMTKLPIDSTIKLAPEFEVEQAPKGIGESRIYINDTDDIKKLEELILQSYLSVN
ncbi:hypothetical protein P9J83_09260 [Clostridium sporogenes]|uniref:Uncharacterized protein n=1 Tax=Clostridium sporogenes TaxID=1509 RepID=A0AAE4FM39_CLOSG|nr:hypothetical protein [Clostridium sporogenes]MDS1003680.1 hypothetical protein [Clostridium sporogenes]